MTPKLLSVIIPVDNAETPVADCVAALLRQSPVPDEIIIVHRESDVAVADSLGEISAQKGMIIVAQPNGEFWQLCDYGSTLAQGKWLYCCDPAGQVSDDLCADFAQAVCTHPQLDLFCFNTLNNGKMHFTPDVRTVRDGQCGLLSGRQASSDILQNGDDCTATCHFIVQTKQRLSWQRRHHASRYLDPGYKLDVLLRSERVWVSERGHYRQYSLPAPVVVAKNEKHFLDCYNAFVNGYEKLIRSSQAPSVAVDLRRLYLIHSFKTMMQLSRSMRMRPPVFLLNAIQYFGRDLRAGTLSDWILLRKPELYNLLFRSHSGTVHV